MAAQGTRLDRFAFIGVAFAGFLTASALVESPLAAGQASATSVPAPATAPPVTTPALTLEDQEAFLKNAKVIRTRSAGKGVTGTLRATLTDGTITHDANIQTIDESRREFRSSRGTELNFVDSWRYNVAAYRLGRLLELATIPPSVERSHNGKTGSFTWWVDDVMMDEGQRLKDKSTAPNAMDWNQQMWHVRLFDQLIANVDRNLGNLLIDKSWTIWMIDHSRAFRLNDKLRSLDNLGRCDRRLYERLKALDQSTLKTAIGDYLTGPETRAILARRDEIIAYLEKAPAAIYDRVKSPPPSPDPSRLLTRR